jgi:ribonuclease G
MIKEMIVNSSALETKIAILEDDQLAELYIERNWSRGILGNIYKGKVTKVLPGMQSAFVNIGLEKDAFLYVSDFIEDTEEYDKVFTEAEEQVATVMAQIDSVEKTPRRDRRPERGRWRDRERREAPRLWPQAPEVIADPNSASESWDVTSETERSAAAGEAPPPLDPSYQIPPPIDSVPDRIESQISSASQADTALPPLSRASIHDDGEVAPFSTDGNNKGGFNPRRRGPGARRKRYTAARHNRPERQSIDDMLREGQEILVQVAKEPIAKKGARVTSHIALPGRYLVYMPTVEHIGVSRKISSEAERIRLKDVVLKHRDRFSGGVIVRTAAEERTEEDLVSDLSYLAKLWEDIRSTSEKSSAPALIHSELNLVQRLLRDQFSFEFASIRVDEEMEYQRVIELSTRSIPTWFIGSSIPKTTTSSTSNGIYGRS